MLVENHTFHYENEVFQSTISLGVVTTAGDEAVTPQELIGEADATLYQAKREGSKRVVA